MRHFSVQSALNVSAAPLYPGLGKSPGSSFTRALLDGLSGAAAAPDGRVTSNRLSEYLSERLGELGEDAQEKPEFISGGEPIVFLNVTKPQGSESERVSTQSDNPATIDELGRRPFAEVVGARIEEVMNSQVSKSHSADSQLGAFMVHIHGPWASGKTSVLNFLREYLKDKNRPRANRWVVIEFNAWRNQRIRPPWWTLIKEIFTQSKRQLSFPWSIFLWLQWLLWRARAD